MESERLRLFWEMVECHDDFTARSIYADWLEDHGQYDEAECLRWMVRNRKRPYRNLATPVQRVWFNLDRDTQVGTDPESDIPAVLYEGLQGGLESANHKQYGSVQEAEAAFYQAWLAAVKKGWTKDDLVIIEELS